MFNKPAIEYFEQGNKLKQEGNFIDAIAAYRRSIEIDSSMADAYYMTGLTLVEIGKGDEAITMFQKTINLAPNFWQSYHKLGDYLQEKGDLKQAVTYYQKSLTINSGYSWSYHNLGWALFKLGNVQEAVVNFKKATELESDNAVFFSSLGDGFKKLKKIDEAISSYQRSLLLNPNFVLPTEFLVPQIIKEISLNEFPFIEKGKTNSYYSKEYLERQVMNLGNWDYNFHFAYGVTTENQGTFQEKDTVMHRFRSELISETVVDLLGDLKTSSTVLDLGCHCGIMSLDFADRGINEVTGYEIRKNNLDQARFLQEYYRINNVKFVQKDVYDVVPEPQYDVVLCLGLLYHVIRPIDVIEVCYKKAKKFVIVDTITHKNPISAYMVIGGKNPNIAVEGTREIEFQPTYRGLIDTMKSVGFKLVVEVVGKCSEHIDLYDDGYRRCLIGFKEEFENFDELVSRLSYP